MRLSVALPVVVAALAGCTADQSKKADLVLLNGKIITVDSADRIAQAVAIADGKIIAVGTDAEVTRLAGDSTRRIDLNGLAVTPGLIDAHAHFASGGVDRLFVLDLSYPTVKSIKDITSRVAAKAAALPPAGWVEGRGWDEGKLDERRLITARDLDRVSAGHPVWLTQTMGHYGVANSMALKLAGITGATADPPGGTIDRYPDGTPTGVLKESAQNLVIRLVPAPTPQQFDAAIGDMARAFNAEGMTGVKEPGIDQPLWDGYHRVLTSGALSVRVFVLWSGGVSVADAEQVIKQHAASTKPYQSTGDDQLIAGGIKLYADGSGGARTAWVYDDWHRNVKDIDLGNRGYPAFNPDTLRQMIRMYHDAGFHVSVHAIGDRAIDWVVDSYAEVLKANPIGGRRHGVIHANIPTAHALEVMQQLQHQFDAGYPEPSATFMWWIGDTYAGNFGLERTRRLNPFKSYLDKGLIWAGGSDFGVTPYAARYGIWASVARQPLMGVFGGDPYGRAESVDVHAALKSFTIWAARQMFLEQKAGSIEVGKYADLAVWDRDPYSVPVDQLKDMQCQLTIFNGKIVYRAANSVLARN